MMKFSIKIRCQKCNGKGGFGNSCLSCDGKGCLKLGCIEWLLWQVAKYLNNLLERYGEL